MHVNAAGGQGTPAGSGLGSPRISGRTLAVVADTLGMTTDEVMTELDSGKKLGDLLKEKGVTGAELAAAMRLAFTGSSSSAGTESDLLSAGEIGDRIWGAMADTLGISSGDLRKRLSSGETLGEIVKEAGVSGETLRSAIAAAVQSTMTYGQNGQSSLYYGSNGLLNLLQVDTDS